MEHPLENIRLILVTGQGRSGTTVLTKALAAHPDIYSNRVESNVMLQVLEVVQTNLTKKSHVAQMQVTRERHDLLFRCLLLHLQFPVENSDFPQKPSAISTYSAIRPDLTEYASAIFPGMHFVCIVRNGIEVVSSRMAHRNMRVHAFDDQCRAWAVAPKMVRWGEGRTDFSLIRQEQLLDPESCRATFSDLFEQVGLDDHPGSADYVMENQWNQTVIEAEVEADRGDLNKRNERWKFWDDNQRQTFVDICGSSMEYFGYEIPWL